MPPSDAEVDALRRLLTNSTSAAVEKAVRSGGEIAEDEMAALRRLARLVKHHQAAEAPPQRRTWPLIVLGASTLLIASVLLFARVWSTEIELEMGRPK